MKIVHITSNTPGEGIRALIEEQRRTHQVQVVTLNEGEISYDDVIDSVLACDRVISWVNAPSEVSGADSVPSTETEALLD